LSYASVIVDYRLPDGKGPEVAKQIRRINPNQDILFASGYTDPEYLTDMLVSGDARSFSRERSSRGRNTRYDFNLTSNLRESEPRPGRDDYSPDKTEARAARFGIVGRSRATSDLIDQIEKLRNCPSMFESTPRREPEKKSSQKLFVPMDCK